MASRKRPRDNHDDTDEEIEVESASSSFRMASQHKRSRVALAAERSGSAVSDDETDADLDDDLRDRIHEDDDGFDTVSITASDVVTEVASDADDDDEERVVRAARMMEKERRRQQNQLNVAQERGVIDEVFCRNFMCHSKLRIKLGPLINFIIGHNGSGKSAVLTALTMCLGGKASATNRAGNLKNLIKEGEDSASLSVKIRNRGDEAYKPELYGSSITVERHFNRAGASGFKLKNDQDRTITTKRADLDDLLDYYAFQLDNPINVLTQDKSRSFISGSSSKDKYRLFIRGTQLETLDHDYNLIEENIDSLVEKLSNREGDLEHLKVRLDEAKQKKDRISAWRKIQDKIQKYSQMHAWAQVEEQEQHLRNLEQALAGIEQYGAQLEQEQEDADGVLEGHTQAADRAKDLLLEFEEALRPFSDAADNANEAWKANTEKLKKYGADERDMRGDIKTHNKEISRLETQIREESARLRAAEGDEQAARSQRLEELEADAARAHAVHDEFVARLPALIDAARQSQERAATAKNGLENKRAAVTEAENKLRQVTGSQGRPFDGYPNGTAALVAKINQETRWRQKPVGPLGQHVRLLKIEWQRQIEKMLGQSLNGFAVTNAYDKGLLMQLMRQTGCQCTVFVGSDTPIDTTSDEPPEGILTVQRALRFDNEFVRKTLVINHMIEQIALQPSTEDARKLLHSGTRNIKAVVGMHQTIRGVTYSLSRSGNEKSDPIAAYEGRTRMKTDREEQIRAEQNRLNEAKREVSDAEKAKRETERAATVAEQAKNKQVREISTKKLLFQQADDMVDEMKAEIDSNRPQQGKLQELQNLLENAKKEKDVAESAFVSMLSEKQDCSENAKELKRVLEQKQAEHAAAQAKVDKQREALDKFSLAKREAAQNKNRIFNDLEANRRTAADEQAKVDAHREVVQNWIAEASRIATRVEVENGLSVQDLVVKVKMLQEQLAKMQREAGGTEEELVRAWKMANDAHHAAVRQFKQHQALHHVLTETLRIRRARWRQFRSLIGLRSRITFSYLLSERNFRGKVILDHHEKLLDLSVEPDIAKLSDAGRETTTLSGGEKSFSTICLLLSIWDAMGSPIRCLDEFDVFMDNVNRKASMDMMIQAARRAVGKQFILITPQAMQNVEIGEDVKIHKMSDPERGQTALPFQTS